jgi:UDP-glucuronate 4-epimerase
MSTLITGAAGFIGSHAAEALLERGDTVVGLDNFHPFYPRAAKERNLARSRDHERFRFVEADIRDPALSERLPDGIRRIVHIAALAGVRPSVDDPEAFSDVNVTGTARMLELARQLGVEAFIFASSSSVYGDDTPVPFSEADAAVRPISPYAATKRAAELLCHSANHLHGLTTICLRLFTVYGPRQRPDLAIHRFARLLRDGTPLPIFGDGTSSRDYTYVDDIVSGFLAAGRWATDHPGGYEVVNLGGSRTVTLDELVRTISEEMGIQPRIDRLPMQQGDVRRTYADLTRAGELLGYEPQVEFREGVRRFLAWFSDGG